MPLLTSQVSCSSKEVDVSIPLIVLKVSRGCAVVLFDGKKKQQKPRVVAHEGEGSTLYRLR